MSDEPKTPRQLFDAIIEARGGIERFNPEQVRLCHAYTAALSARPSEIDVVVVEKLASLLPQPARKDHGGPDVIKVVFVGGSGRARLGFVNALETEPLVSHLEKLDTGIEPLTMAEALETIEFLRREIVVLHDRLEAAQAPPRAEPVERTLSIPARDIVPPPPRALPPPYEPSDPPSNGKFWNTLNAGRSGLPPSANWTEAGGYSE
jgi:hypothetical protein